MKIKNIEPKVKKILENYPATRDSDDLLMLKFCEMMGCDVNRSYITMLLDPTTPKRDTVTRCRRKLQERYKDLRGTRRMAIKRAELEEEYKEYART